MRIARLLVLLTATAARAEAPAPAALAELAAIGAKRPAAQPHEIKPICTRLAKADAAALKQRVLAWIDQQHPEEQPAPDTVELVFTACKSGSGAIADISQDRIKRKGDRFATRRNYIVRATGDKLETIAERQSTATNSWMEWADEGRLRFVTELDVDGDGAVDLVWSDFNHEGGAVSTDDTFYLRLPSGKDRMIARVRELSDERVVDGRLVLAGRPRDDLRPRYACVGTDLRVAPCAASVAAQRAVDRADIAAKLAGLTTAPDHDQVVDWLATLGVTAGPALLAALPATTPQQRAERHVAAFLTSQRLDETFQEVFDQPHPEATAFFDQLATQLGDARCTPTPLTDPVRAKIADWIGKQDKAPEAIELTPECGMYAWVEWNHKGDQDRNEVLVALDGPAPVKVAKFKQDPAFDGPRPPGHQYDGIFFQHGDTTVGFVIRSGNVSVIANDKVVAQSHGEIRRYGFDRRWPELALDVIVDSGTLFHPSPAGLEKLDRALVADREARRKALERLLDNPPSKDPQYLAALHTLGADARLVAECKKL